MEISQWILIDVLLVCVVSTQKERDEWIWHQINYQSFLLKTLCFLRIDITCCSRKCETRLLDFPFSYTGLLFDNQKGRSLFTPSPTSCSRMNGCSPVTYWMPSERQFLNCCRWQSVVCSQLLGFLLLCHEQLMRLTGTCLLWVCHIMDASSFLYSLYIVYICRLWNGW